MMWGDSLFAILTLVRVSVLCRGVSACLLGSMVTNSLLGISVCVVRVTRFMGLLV